MIKMEEGLGRSPCLPATASFAHFRDSLSRSLLLRRNRKCWPAFLTGVHREARESRAGAEPGQSPKSGYNP